MAVLKVIHHRPDGIFAGGTIILAHPSVLARQKVEGSLQIKAGSLVFQRLTHGLETLFGIPIIYLVVIQRQHLKGMKAIGCTDKRLSFSGTQYFQMTGAAFNHCQFSRRIGDGQDLGRTDRDCLQEPDCFMGVAADGNILYGTRSGVQYMSTGMLMLADFLAEDTTIDAAIVGKDRILGGVPHEHGFLITSASEISAILALASDRDDLRARLERMVVAYTYDKKPVTVKDLGCVGAMMVLLKDAINPNLVQTLEGEPVFVHGFPFANIAHGTNSIIATKAALKLGDYVITEAGFASDLGGEKFMDIVCRQSGMRPDCVVIVASIKALMTHGGGILEQPETLTLDALRFGLCNLDKHIENMSSYGLPIVVSINHFAQDSQEEMDLVMEHCREIGVRCAFSDAFIKGGEGTIDLANTVLEALENDKPDFKFLYPDDASIKDKIEAVATKIYGAGSVTYTPAADKAIAQIEADGFGNLPVCIAKTQASLTDDSKLKGAPRGWVLSVREVQVSSGAGFVVPICGTMTLMPGLPKVPAAMRMDLTADGRIVGLK